MNRRNHPLGTIAQAVLMATTLTNTSLVSAAGAVPQTAAQTDSLQPVSAHTVGKSPWGPDLEALSRDRVYEFAFIGGSLKLRGSDAAPIRPIALPARGSRDNDGGES